MKIGRVEVSCVENSSSLLVAAELDGTLKLMVAEPITWSYVAIELGKAAASWLAGKILSSVFGSDAGQAPVLRAIRSAVVELKTFVRQELATAVIEECAAQCDTAWRDLLDYQDVPTHRVARLDNALSESRNAMMRLAREGVGAFGPYVHAVSIHSVALQADAQRVGVPAAWRSVVRAMDESCSLVSEWVAALNSEHAERLASVSAISHRMKYPNRVKFMPERGEPPGRNREVSQVPHYRFTWYGGSFEDRDLGRVESHRRSVIDALKAELDLLSTGVLLPVAAVLSDWRSISLAAAARTDGQTKAASATELDLPSLLRLSPMF